MFTRYELPSVDGFQKPLVFPGDWFMEAGKAGWWLFAIHSQVKALLLQVSSMAGWAVLAKLWGCGSFLSSATTCTAASDGSCWFLLQLDSMVLVGPFQISTFCVLWCKPVVWFWTWNGEGRAARCGFVHALPVGQEGDKHFITRLVCFNLLHNGIVGMYMVKLFVCTLIPQMTNSC